MYLLNEAIKTPDRALKFFRLAEVAAAMKKPPIGFLPPVIKLLPVKALAHLLLSDWTKQSYKDTRQLSKQQGADIWPSYDKLQNEELKCHLPIIEYGELQVVIPLADHLIQNDQR